MATLMDVSLFSYFGSIFLFLMVFVIVYGLLSMSKMFSSLKGANGIYAIIALGIAFFVLMYKSVTSVLSVMVPWFAVLIIAIFLIMFVIKMFSQDDALFTNIIKSKGVYWTILTFVIIIVLASFSSTFGQTLLSGQEPIETTTTEVIGGIEYTETTTSPQPSAAATTGTDDFGNNLLKTLVNPKVLGLMLLMIVGLFTIMLMADSQVLKG
ncbi:MAG: hypothetical protein AB7V77_05425 [Candidatus Woesearchaeota archaeon]